jgi:hypothetical protein
MQPGGHFKEAILQRKVTCLWKEPAAGKPYRTGVSLHSHTNRSQESLSFIAKYASRYWLFRRAMAVYGQIAQDERAITMDLCKGYWTPPLPPAAAFTLEKNQIENVLGLNSMISISDHDNIEAPMLLRVVPEARRIPVSVEWTAPYQDTVFHFGVHNLPSARAELLMAQLSAYTDSPSDKRLPELLSALNDMSDVLVILNHPLWDLQEVGKEKHERALRNLLCGFGQFVHALEMNGLRSWNENQAVLHLSEGCNQLVISGGDRHGCEPNANLNLTNAESFAEFVHEVRRERLSHVLFMPQYTEPYALRVLQTLLDATREYPDYSIGSRHWDERVFHPNSAGTIRPLAELWVEPRWFIRYFLATVRLLEMAPVRRAVQLALAKPQPDFGFSPGDRQEVPS